MDQPTASTVVSLMEKFNTSGSRKDGWKLVTGFSRRGAHWHKPPLGTVSSLCPMHTD